MTTDLSTILQQLIATGHEADRATRLTTSPHAGLALAYTPGQGGEPQRLKLSRLGVAPYKDDILAARQAVKAITGQQVIEESGSLREDPHWCVVLQWRPINLQNFFQLSPAEQARLKKMSRRR